MNEPRHAFASKKRTCVLDVIPYACASYTLRARVVNMAQVAEGLGEYAERVEKPDEIIPAIKRAFKENAVGRPAYLEMMCVQNRDYPGWIRPE